MAAAAAVASAAPVLAAVVDLAVLIVVGEVGLDLVVAREASVEVAESLGKVRKQIYVFSCFSLPLGALIE